MVGQNRVYGVARHEEARVTCDLDANPSSGLQFRWLFNSSAGIMELPSSTWTSEGSRSVARYLPSSDLDFGSLLCSASNAIGHQTVPCVYHVIPAGKKSNYCYSSLYPAFISASGCSTFMIQLCPICSVLSTRSIRSSHTSKYRSRKKPFSPTNLLVRCRSTPVNDANLDNIRQFPKVISYFTSNVSDSCRVRSLVSQTIRLL